MILAKHHIKSFIALLFTLSIMNCGSSSPTDPRETVIAFFGAMEKNDQAALAHLLDLAELMKNTQIDYALQTDEPRVFTSPVQILEDLTGTGETKTRWFSLQRIVNKAEVAGPTATVEVTFIDQKTSNSYLTKFGLHIVN
jgi:hypothetical protein